MHAASREAAASLRERTQAMVGSIPTAEGRTEFAHELYAVGAVLEGQPRLRRALGDASTDPAGRSALVEQLFGARIGTSPVQVVRDAVTLRWSSPWDLVDVVESTADDAMFAAAEVDAALDQVEDELFRFERVLDAASDLTGLLDESSVDPQRRIGLLDSVLGGKVHAITRALLEHAVTSGRQRSIAAAIDDLLEAAAARRERSVARVITAVELTVAQQDRLASTLSAMYGRPISVRSALDPAIRGGLVVRVGDEIIDGSVATRLSQLRTAFAG